MKATDSSPSPAELTTFPSAYKRPLRSRERVQAVRTLPEFVEKVAALQPHDQVEILLSTEDPESGQGQKTADQRGFLMEIRLGPEASFCVKRTF